MVRKKNEAMQGEKVIRLVFHVKVCVVCFQGDYKNLSAFLAVWLLVSQAWFGSVSQKL